ncbi:hypothetical protein EDI_323530 [Entamoeba dispar SAW760]|uniref:Uncharacterized protein n=1 Tax=Entamoeba dispar (strain ATCC PRA-260 / SAW760) TaxID=370354 RepID=B0EQE8_ENTDS|nr:uncharacterized protein EDI_323530 [Entamoeba dispar SAW760]EDR23248.1 hypothetical protein EDI_323530 [Entamoeba dispar SAW760]|eukprot:EDR23248.1 hypothetical protein EDI_323530 [Entamoeba dispar SAW760]
MTDPRISNEALKQREGRNKRAICNRELLLLSFICGAEVTIDKTKKTSRAKKVFVGSSITFDGKYSTNDILENAYFFECAVRTLWKKAKASYETTLTLTKEVVKAEIELIRQNPELIKVLSDDFKVRSSEYAVNSVGKRRTKNKEAAFSNFLAYKLLMNGFTLTCQVSAQKVTTKTLNFYTWKSYKAPNGVVIKKESVEVLTKALSKEIKQRLTKEATVKITPNILSFIGAKYLIEKLGLHTIDTCDPMSAFKPCNNGIVDNDFSFIKLNHLHPFTPLDTNFM